MSLTESSLLESALNIAVDGTDVSLALKGARVCLLIAADFLIDIEASLDLLHFASLCGGVRFLGGVRLDFLDNKPEGAFFEVPFYALGIGKSTLRTCFKVRGSLAVSLMHILGKLIVARLHRGSGLYLDSSKN